ncbi:MAG TPA: hypothetical protein VMV72_11500 [Verrucomicrobiae bacterium]|nr:hypothetical protein [Verrucomicrobiae bacterium]
MSRRQTAPHSASSSGAPLTTVPVGSHNHWAAAGVCLFLVGAIFVGFGQTLRYGFVDYDDDGYVYKNPHVIHGLDLKGVAWAFTHSVMANWHPLTVMSHMLDCQVYGLNAGGHHLTNLLLHAATAVLLFLVLRRMTQVLWPSAFVAAVFAIHPLRVESVAWIAERKDVLSGLFFVLTLGAYVRYVCAPPSWGRYLTVVFLFTLGLMSKPMLVTVPFVLLLLDYWPLNRRGATNRLSTWWRLLVEKIPLFACSFALCLVTFLVQRKDTGIPFPLRISNALVSYVAYCGQMFWPVHLAVLYPYPINGLPTGRVVLASVLLIVVSLGALFWRRSRPYFLMGWLWYLGMLAPAIGVVAQAGAQSRADRYTYLPQIGLYILVTWMAVELTASWRSRRWVLGTSALVVLAVLIACARVQTAYWRDSRSLWTHALACTTDNSIAENNLAWILGTLPPTEGGDPVRAITLARHACELTGNSDADSLDTLAVAYAANGRFDDAAETTQKAIALARADGQTALAEKMEARLELYRGRNAYRPPADATTQGNP